MPIQTDPDGTLDIENATLRSRGIVALTNMVAGNDVVRSGGPALEVYGDPGPRLELVSNTAATDGTATFTRLESNVGVFSIQSGTDGVTNGPITFGGFANERMRIDADGNVGIGKTDPGAALDVVGDVEISSNLAVSGSKFTYDNTNTTVFTGSTNAIANEIGYLDMSTSSSSNNIHVKIYIKYGQSSALGDAEYSFYIRPNSANFSLIYDYRNQLGPITPVVYRTNATDLWSGGTPGVVRFGYSIASAQNVIWRVEVQQRSGNVTFYPTNTGSAVDTTGLVQVTPAPFTRFDSNVAVNTDDLFVDTVNSRVGIGTDNPSHGRMQLVCSSQSPDGGLTIRGGDFNAGLGAMWVEGSGSGQRFNIQAYKNEGLADPAGVNPSTADADVYQLCLNPKGGNVGVGITDPSSVFNTYGGSLWDGSSMASKVCATLQVGRGSGTGASANDIGFGGILEFRHHSDSRFVTIESVSEAAYSGDIGLRFKTHDSGALVERMRIDSSGNVGIGLTNPGTIGSTDYPDVTPILHLMGQIYQSEPADNETWSIGVLTNDYYFRVSVNGTPLENVARINYDNGAYVDLITFTGQHRAAHINDIPPNRCIDYEGLIVSADRNQYESVNGDKSRGIKAITVNEAVPLLSLSKVAYDKKCFGIISASEDPDTRTQSFGNLKTYHYKEPGDTFIFTNSVGEGAIWVVNTNGSLESGDYITTSNVAGYGQRQDSEFLANYTVAKITMDCDFEPVTQPTQVIKREMGNVDYWIKKTITNVSFDDYSKLADEYRATDTEIYYSNETGEISVEKYNTLEPDVQSTYTELTRTIYQEINIVTSKKNEDGHDILEVRQEYVNVLDEHGQIQWEDDPSGATEKAYKIRYLDADGNITDEANHVYKAVFVGCTYHCG